MKMTPGKLKIDIGDGINEIIELIRTRALDMQKPPQSYTR
jgi:hypothetical protein